MSQTKETNLKELIESNYAMTNTQTVKNRSSELHNEFWNSACKFYEEKSNQRLLLNLQDEFRINVNRLLFCCWFSQNFKLVIGLDTIFNEPKMLSELDTSIAHLRKTRRIFETKWKKPIVGNYNMARYHLLESELVLEKESQSLLVTYYCAQKVKGSFAIDHNTQDFLITENIERLCFPASASRLINQELRDELQQLSLSWIHFGH